jgi:glycosyltransferase involved in cell wall biosynthesis
MPTISSNLHVMTQSKRIAVFLSFSGQGGVEPMALNLVEQLAEDGVPVDLVTVRGSKLPRQLSERIWHLDLGLRHSTLAPLALARYLRTRRPHTLLAAKERGIRSAVLARRLVQVPTRLIGWVHSNMSQGLAHRNCISRWLHYQSIRRSFPVLDMTVGVSAGVTDDIRQIAGLPEDKVAVVPNPVITDRIMAMSKETPPHPWFSDGGPPIILSAGRLVRQKDFPTLIKAFSQLRERILCRLLIIGEGDERSALLGLAEQLQIADSVSLPGYTTNPYSFMANADAFVLSSAWEGFGAVLAEAMALGTPVAATDCPSGPCEILRNGLYGPLTPVGDSAALAAAIEQVLRDPLPPETLMQAAKRYTARNCANQFMPLLLGECSLDVVGQ